MKSASLLLVAGFPLALPAVGATNANAAPRAFIRTTKDCAAWNKLQQQASNNQDDDQDEVDDQLVLPAFYRASTYQELLQMRETTFAYDRHRPHLNRRPKTELEFLEETYSGGRSKAAITIHRTRP